MENDFIRKLNEAHNIECPVCGQKASYTLTSDREFKTNTCHDELNDLVNEALDRFYPGSDNRKKR